MRANSRSLKDSRRKVVKSIISRILIGRHLILMLCREYSWISPLPSPISIPAFKVEVQLVPLRKRTYPRRKCFRSTCGPCYIVHAMTGALRGDAWHLMWSHRLVRAYSGYSQLSLMFMTNLAQPHGFTKQVLTYAKTCANLLFQSLGYSRNPLNCYGMKSWTRARTWSCYNSFVCVHRRRLLKLVHYRRSKCFGTCGLVVI